MMLETFPPLYHYVARLIRMYPFSKHVARYMYGWPEECKKKYNDVSITKMALKAQKDEKGHDLLILKDLKELKIPTEIALEEFRSNSVAQVISAFKESVKNEPVHFLSWLYYIENKTINIITKEIFEGYKKMLGPFHKATRFWRIHSALGPEVQHVVTRRQSIEALPAVLRQSVEKEISKVDLILSTQQLDLDFDRFGRFIELYAPHLIDLAYQDRLGTIDQLQFNN